MDGKGAWRDNYRREIMGPVHDFFSLFCCREVLAVDKIRGGLSPRLRPYPRPALTSAGSRCGYGNEDTANAGWVSAKEALPARQDAPLNVASAM